MSKAGSVLQILSDVLSRNLTSSSIVSSRTTECFEGKFLMISKVLRLKFKLTKIRSMVF